MKIGVYCKDLPLIEQTILSINNNAKKTLRHEALEYIRINKSVQKLDINEQYVNFRNGMYDLINKRLIPHSPKFFTTCQIHANYFEDGELATNRDVEKFLNEIMCGNMERIKVLLQIIRLLYDF